jgi:hypothetical protein
MTTTNKIERIYSIQALALRTGLNTETIRRGIARDDDACRKLLLSTIRDEIGNVNHESQIVQKTLSPALFEQLYL